MIKIMLWMSSFAGSSVPYPLTCYLLQLCAVSVDLLPVVALYRIRWPVACCSSVMYPLTCCLLRLCAVSGIRWPVACFASRQLRGRLASVRRQLLPADGQFRAPRPADQHVSTDGRRGRQRAQLAGERLRGQWVAPRGATQYTVYSHTYAH